MSSPANWQRADPRYKYLDDYVKWDEVEGKLAENSNLLEHLNHLRTWEKGVKRGPTVLFRIFNMISREPGKSMPWASRGVNKSIGTVASQALCRYIKVPIDCIYDDNSVSGLRWARFFHGIADNIQECQEFVDERPVLKRDFPPWRFNIDIVKHITFYQDPNVFSRAPGSLRWRIFQQYWVDCIEKLRYLGDNNQLDDAEFDEKYRAAYVELETAEVARHFQINYEKLNHMWMRIFCLLNRIELESFIWSSEINIPLSLLYVLGKTQPTLKLLNLSIQDYWFHLDWPLLDTTFEYDHTIISSPPYDWVPSYRQRPPRATDRSYRLNRDCQVYITISSADTTVFDHWIPLFRPSFTKIEKLSLKSPIPDGRDHFVPTESLPNFDLPNLRKLGHKMGQAQFLNVVELELVEQSSDLALYVMLCKPKSLLSLKLDCCFGLQKMYDYLVNIDPCSNLRRFSIQFGDHVKAMKAPHKYWLGYVQDMRMTTDFLRRGLFQLEDLEIRGCFGDSTSKPPQFSGLTTNLYLGIRAHLPSLVRLSVLNHGIDFTFHELSEIGQLAPRLSQLEISCSPDWESGQPVDHGERNRSLHRTSRNLWGNLSEALKYFNPVGRRKPLSVTILRSGTGPIGANVVNAGDTIRKPLEIREVFRDCTMSINRLIERDAIPIVHFAYYGETAHYIDEKTRELTKYHQQDFDAGFFLGIPPTPNRGLKVRTGAIDHVSLLQEVGNQPDFEPYTLYHEFLSANENWKRRLFIPFPSPVHGRPRWNDDEPIQLQNLPRRDPVLKYSIFPNLGAPGTAPRKSIGFSQTVPAYVWPYKNLKHPAFEAHVTPNGLLNVDVDSLSYLAPFSTSKLQLFKVRSNPVDKVFILDFAGQLIQARFEQFHSPWDYNVREESIKGVSYGITMGKDHAGVSIKKKKTYWKRANEIEWDAAWRDSLKPGGKTRGTSLLDWEITEVGWERDEAAWIKQRWTEFTGVQTVEVAEFWTMRVGDRKRLEKVGGVMIDGKMIFVDTGMEVEAESAEESLDGEVMEMMREVEEWEEDEADKEKGIPKWDEEEDDEVDVVMEETNDGTDSGAADDEGSDGED